MISKNIMYFGQPCTIACDANCQKAWGINNRPSLVRDVSGNYVPMTPDERSDAPDEDDTCFLADDELGVAPADPGTYEGAEAKPVNEKQRLNKWCCRECERSSLVDEGESIVLRDFTGRRYNIAPHERD